MNTTHNQQIKNQIITTQPSYKVTNTYNPHFRTDDSWRRRTENFPTASYEENTVIDRTYQPSATPKRRSVLKQPQYSSNNSSKLDADRSINQSKKVSGGHGHENQSNLSYHSYEAEKLNAKNSYSSSEKGVGGIPKQQGSTRPFYCRSPFFICLAILGLLAIAGILFLSLKSRNDQPQPAPTSETNIRKFQDTFDEPVIAQEQASSIKNNQAADTKIEYYIDENGMRQKLIVPTTPSEPSTGDQYTYSNALEQQSGTIQISPGVKKPYTRVQTIETETIVDSA